MMIVAEELDVSMKQMKYLPPDPNLLGLASAQLGVPAGSLTVKDGVVSGGGKSVSRLASSSCAGTSTATTTTGRCR